MIETDVGYRDLASLIRTDTDWTAARRDDRLIEWVGYVKGQDRSAPRGVIARWTSLNGKAVKMQVEFKWLEGLTSPEFSFWAGPTFWFSVEGEWIDEASFDHPGVEREMTFGVRALRDIARARQREAAEKTARTRQRRLKAERESLDEL